MPLQIAQHGPKERAFPANEQRQIPKSQPAPAREQLPATWRIDAAPWFTTPLKKKAIWPNE